MGWLFGGGAQPVKPWLLDPSGKYGAVYDQSEQEVWEHSMTDRQSRLYDQDMDDWREMKNLREQRQAIFQEMAQTTGPTPKEWTSRAGKMEAGDPFSPIQVAGGPAPSDPMARYGRPKKWPYLQSIVNMGKV